MMAFVGGNLIGLRRMSYGFLGRRNDGLSVLGWFGGLGRE
jgi:hypothetical protein